MSKKISTTIVFLFIELASLMALNSGNWNDAEWITSVDCKDEPNTWISFRKTFNLKNVPDSAVSKIAVDSKYWLYINGIMVAFEGGLKRGPNPDDTYYDEINIAPFLKAGDNSIAILLCFFGKNGRSHKNSGKAGLLFYCNLPEENIISNESWKAIVNPAYGTCEPPMPIHTLAESNILYDARLELTGWEMLDYTDNNMPYAVGIGYKGSPPWNNLVKRPIPQWKDYGLKKFTSTVQSHDTLYCNLPYNMQFTPYIKVKAPAGEKIILITDNYTQFKKNLLPVRAEYITKEGIQEYESFGWMNGHKLICILPENIEEIEVMYRETGYDAEFEGKLVTSDQFFNKLSEKAVRTLYINMRDNYMDCPDRERSQWTGDAVTEAHEAFYALSLSGHLLGEKWLRELMNWQRDNGVIYSPVPSGTPEEELSGQSLASIGYYGLWTYYLYTGNKQLIQDFYPHAKKYMQLWQKNEKGLVNERWGEWAWGDWGDEKDMHLLNALWYFIAAKGMYNVARELGIEEDVRDWEYFIEGFKKAFNQEYWTGKCYRSPGYKGKDDERVQALAVVSGIADKDKYPELLNVFLTEEHCSPYMEKYVFEAMMIMGYEKEAEARHKKRFGYMVNFPLTTLFEDWGEGKDNFSGGTVNHGWSGGGYTVLAQYICGVAPLTPGFKNFSVLPQPGSIEQASLSFITVAGKISTDYTVGHTEFKLNVEVPALTVAFVGVPKKDYKKIEINNTLVWKNGKYLPNNIGKQSDKEISEKHIVFEVQSGNYAVVAE
jgi:alpha-L-rhamnosidase